MPTVVYQTSSYMIMFYLIVVFVFLYSYLLYLAVAKFSAHSEKSNVHENVTNSKGSCGCIHCFVVYDVCNATYS